MSYLIHLQQFEGPLGLLLYLIRKEEMDIMDINVGEITQQYLEYIRMMKELDLEVAGEFVAMAATLIHIKSRMLLPQYDETGEVVETEDPRKELVQKLLDYKKYQDAAKELYARPLLNRDVFARGIREDLRDEESLLAVITEDDGLFSLVAAYRRAVRKALRAVHQVRPRTQSIAGRIMEVQHRLITGTRILLRDLMNVGPAAGEAGFARTQLLITFLSMLELGRMGFVSLFQNETYGDIHIETLKPIENNVLERVQEFENTDADAVARSIMNQANDDRIDMQEMMNEDVESDQLALGGLSESTSAAEPNIQPSESEIMNTVADGSFSDQDDMAMDEIATDEDILAAEAELDARAASAPDVATERPDLPLDPEAEV